MTSEGGGDTIEVLAFEVAGRRFGLWLADVLEVLPAVAIEGIPGAPSVVEGLINLRGTIVPVLDFRARFRLPAKRLEHADHLIVTVGLRRPVALRVDRATALLQVPLPAVEEAEDVALGARSFAGVIKLADGLMLVHDLRSFLSEAEAEALEEALGAIGVPGR